MTTTAPAAATTVSGLIDVHTHFPAKAHADALTRAAGDRDDGIKLPSWNSERTLDVLGDVGIGTAVLSPTSPPPAFATADDARRTARDFNEELAAQIASAPASFGGVAFIPLPFVDVALDELAYALDVLGLDGAHLFTNYQGRYPGDPAFRPLLEELNRRGTTVMTHPTSPQNVGPMLVGGLIPPTLEFVFDTTRMASDLLYNGALAAFPDIKWILAHGGGTLLQTLNRLTNSIHIMREETTIEFGGLPETDEAGRDLMRGLFIDVTWNTAEPMLSGLNTLMGSSQLLLGTDMPFEHGPWIKRGIDALRENPVVAADAKRMILRDNALRLFPALAARLLTT